MFRVNRVTMRLAVDRGRPRNRAAFEQLRVQALRLDPPNRQLAAKVRVFIDLLVAHFGKRPRWDLVE